MKPVKLIILLIVLILGLLVVWKIKQQEVAVNRGLRSGEIALMFPDLDSDAIIRVEISSLQNESQLFRKEAGVWEVSKGKDLMSQLMSHSNDEDSDLPPTQENPANDVGPSGDIWRTFYRADPESVQNIIEAFADMQHGTLKTDDPEKQNQMKVSNNIVGTEVVFYDAQMNELAHLFVGDMGSTFQSTNVRKDGSDEIYEVPVALTQLLRTPLFSLRDRNIYTIPTETIATISIDDIEGAGALSMNLTRADGQWSGTDMSGEALELDPEKVGAITDALGSLSANSFVDMESPPVPYGEEDDDPYGLNNPSRVILFTTAENVSHTLTVGKKDGSTYYATVNEYPTDVFRVSSAVIDKISPEPASLAPGAEVTDESAEVQDLSGQGFQDETMEIPPEVLEQLGY